MTTATATLNTPAKRELSNSGIAMGAGLGAVAGAIGNVALMYGGAAAGASLSAEFQPGVVSDLPLVAVIMASLIPAAVAALLAMVLNRFTARPSQLFIGIAVVFGLLSMGGPATLVGAGTGLKVILSLMHVVSGVTITGGIVWRGRANA